MESGPSTLGADPEEAPSIASQSISIEAAEPGRAPSTAAEPSSEAPTAADIKVS